MAPMYPSNTVRRFARLRAEQPSISDSELLNSNNQTGFTGKADVVVAGAGILGLCYAIHLKNISPSLKIEVFEKSPAPIQKIGESTLSPFAKFTQGDILPHDYLLRLFAMKDGLQFYGIDDKGASVSYADIGGVDISFQLDRRVSELFFTMWAQSLGINVYHGISAGFQSPGNGALTSCDGSDVEGVGSMRIPQVLLKDSTLTVGAHISARLICDATGFSRSLTSKFGNKETFEGWNCNAYWAYFKEKDIDCVESRLHHWDYPCTKHMCFPEGWGWFIGLVSWHHASLANMMDLVAFIIQNARAGVPADQIPYTKELSQIFECPYELITSIGWAIRDDHEFPEDLHRYGNGESEQKFKYFQKKYPTLDRLMTDHYTLLPKYYGKQTYYARKSLAYRSPIVAGKGWIAIGNSAGFTNPLYSPGINAGICGAFRAADMTARLFRVGSEAFEYSGKMLEFASEHQRFVHDIAMPRLNQMNRFWYNAFRDHRLFNAMLVCHWALVIDDLNGDRYKGKRFTENDSRWLIGAGVERYQDFMIKVLAILETDDGRSRPLTEEAVREVQRLSKACLIQRKELFPGNDWSKIFRHRGSDFGIVPGKSERSEGQRHWGVKCHQCEYWICNDASACPICGNSNHLQIRSSDSVITHWED
ncbi:MAG: hypothetical protein M1820_002740 [Bogoriella megaspora]|nr:MAG: hypothetical protein M1820_002740 [Bogoriella megaspora]